MPTSKAAEKLETLLSFRGLTTPEKPVMRDCLRLLQEQELDLVYAHIVAHSKARGLKGIYSFDSDLEDRGLELLPVE